MSNTLKLGNGQWATGKDTVLSFSDTNNNYKPLPFSFSRDSSATVVNKDGLIETVGSGEPRIDFKDNTKGALLLEPERRNLLPYSNDFSNDAWSKNQSGTGLIPVVTSNNAISPDGTLNATKVVFNTGSGVSSSDISMLEDTVSATSGVAINQSVYLKGENGGETILIRGAGGSSYTTLTLTNEWVRYNATETSGSISSTWAIGLRQGLGGVVINSTATIYMAFAQFEIGSYATSYIPTSGQANGVTRVADACNNGANDQVINSTEGVLYAEISALEDDGTSRYISINDGATNNIVSISFFNDLTIRSRIVIGGVTTYLTSGAVTQTNYFKIGLKYKLNDYALWINGVEVDSNISLGVFAPNTLTRLDFARWIANPFYGNVKDVRVYNTALTDQELAALTTI